jgi:hypothetical protein
VLRTAFAISRLFIRASNQQSNQDIAPSLQFCDSSGDAILSLIPELAFRFEDVR